jgi:hypothetical protein
MATTEAKRKEKRFCMIRRDEMRGLLGAASTIARSVGFYRTFPGLEAQVQSTKPSGSENQPGVTACQELDAVYI